MMDNTFKRSYTFWVAIVALTAFCIISIAEIVLFFLFRQNNFVAWAPLLYTQDVQYILRAAGTQFVDMPTSWVNAVGRMNTNNPDVLRELAFYKYQKNEDKLAFTLASKVLKQDPKNIESYALYTKTQTFLGYSHSVIEESMLLSGGFLNDATQLQVRKGIKMYSPKFDNSMKNQGLDFEKYSNIQVKEVLARLFYLFGESLLAMQPKGTLYWWKLAVEVAPGISYYSVEEARLLFTSLQDTSAALRVLKECQKSVSARNDCSEVLKKLEQGIVVPPGSLKQTILKQLYLKSTVEPDAPKL